MPAISQQLTRRDNWAKQEAGVIVVFCIVFIVGCGLIALWVSKCLARRKAKQQN